MIKAPSEEQPFNFYTDDSKIYPAQVAKFLRTNFTRISEEGNDTLKIIKNEGKLLKPFNYKTETLSYLKQHINHPDRRSDIENELVKKESDIMKSWKLLDPEPYNLNKDTKDTVYIPFKNGVCCITKDGCNMIDYSNSEIGYFAETNSCNHQFEKFDTNSRQQGQFEKFLLYAIVGRVVTDYTSLTAMEAEDVKAFYSMMGYMISNYKNPSQSVAIILSDHEANNIQRNGGRGKTLITKALQQLRAWNSRAGLEFDAGYRHIFGDLEVFQDIYVIDDVPVGFKYDALYTNISGDIKPERKGTHTSVIPFEDTPKFIITTNNIVPHDKQATSTNRRFAEYQLTDFWNNDNRPVDYFKGNFFDDWDELEWQLFHEFMVVCVTEFLENGLQKIAYSKEADNFRSAFTNDVLLEEFERIFEVMKLKGSFSVNDIVTEYKNSIWKDEKFFSSRTTRDYIIAYISYHRFDIKFIANQKRWVFKQ